VRKSRKKKDHLAIIRPQRTKHPKQNKEENLMKYVCDVCGWEYDEEQGYPEGGIAPGTKWEDLPEDFECPLCGVGKDQFSAEE
jgi:rubredoxin-NAD+ reductase